MFGKKSDLLIVGEGHMSPFNSQNTLFFRDAFWGLFLPSTTSFRVCDIWRGYWTERMLWEIGGRLAFQRPSAIQERNSHSLLKDFKDEIDLYVHAGEMVDFLIQWGIARHDGMLTDSLSLPQR
jgi:hypothetical protein